MHYEGASAVHSKRLFHSHDTEQDTCSGRNCKSVDSSVSFPPCK